MKCNRNQWQNKGLPIGSFYPKCLWIQRSLFKAYKTFSAIFLLIRILIRILWADIDGKRYSAMALQIAGFLLLCESTGISCAWYEKLVLHLWPRKKLMNPYDCQFVLTGSVIEIVQKSTCFWCKRWNLWWTTLLLIRARLLQLSKNLTMSYLHAPYFVCA